MINQNNDSVFHCHNSRFSSKKMSDGEEPCSCLFCLTTGKTVGDAEPEWGRKTTHLILLNTMEIDPERNPIEVMMHLTSMKHQFFCSGQLDLVFAVDWVNGGAQSLSVDIYWRSAPPVMVKAAGKGL